MPATAPSDAFNSLLAKVIAHSPSPDFAVAVGRATRALSEFRIDGVGTNIAFLRNVLAHPDFIAGKVHTRWVDEHIADLAAHREQRQRFIEPAKAAAANDTRLCRRARQQPRSARAVRARRGGESRAARGIGSRSRPRRT